MKLFIKNRKQQKMAVLVEGPDDCQALAFVMHGLGDSKDSPAIKTIVKCFLNNNYKVVSFDTTNTFGESDGDFADANISTYFEDLVDIITWSKTQDFYQEAFVLCGHSLGAICSAFYAENNPEKIKALFLMSTVVNAELSKENYTKKELKDWEEKGYLIEDWGDYDVKIKWSYMKEKEKYDLLKKADKLKMPVLIVAGELDNTTPVKHQKILFDKLVGPKDFYIIKEAPHSFREDTHLNQLSDILNSWIKNLL